MSFLASLLLAASLTSQPAPAGAQDPTAPAPVELEGLTVTGRRLDDVISDFVTEASAPVRRRGLARWRDPVCVGVVNLRADAAAFIADRVTAVAADLGVDAGREGCRPNIAVIATDDASTLAAALTEARRRAFRTGATGTDRGGAALRDFVETERPVRWWQTSLPIDSRTGQRAVRAPGVCRGECRGVGDFAPIVVVDSASLLRSTIIDNLQRAIVIIDVDDIQNVSLAQLADYVAMVSLAQIDPNAQTDSYASILNVFAMPDTAEGLTEWDRAYLAGLYNSEQNLRSTIGNHGDIVASIRRAHGRLLAEADAEAGAEAQP
ncbi:MAG TPA: hypothetical protein VGN74_04495 [Brevundimonas sp.]|jgi:hypothetical protein|uniref:hypothetical protein n=1 Tax=Brevundimonas sp. TaxID=1871086 RepID=UPI002E0F6554|nr:hypothetical protein [Brevundimonas sp.]